ncbi:hypothetical protein V5799_029583, partial [Amblyomma americanum]
PALGRQLPAPFPARRPLVAEEARRRQRWWGLASGHRSPSSPRGRTSPPDADSSSADC